MCFCIWRFQHKCGMPRYKDCCPQSGRQTGMTFQNLTDTITSRNATFHWNLQCAGSDKMFLSLANITAVSRPFTGPGAGPAVHAVACRLLQCSRDWKKGRVYPSICALSAQNGVRRTYSSEVVSVRPSVYSFIRFGVHRQTDRQTDRRSSAEWLKAVYFWHTTKQMYKQWQLLWSSVNR